MQKVAIKESSCKKSMHISTASSVECKTAVMEACKRSGSAGVLIASLIVPLLLGYGICAAYSYFSVLPLLFDFFAGSAHECYYLPDCQGESFPVENARECCVGTEDGVSYSHDSDCTIRQCIGKKIYSRFQHNYTTPFCAHGNDIHSPWFSSRVVQCDGRRAVVHIIWTQCERNDKISITSIPRGYCYRTRHSK